MKKRHLSYMKTVAVLTVASSIPLLSPAFAQSMQRSQDPNAQIGQAQTGAGQSETQSRTSQFVEMAVSGNMFEIQSSQIAETRTNNAEIKQFARQMIDDHTKALQNLVNAASSVTGSTGASRMSQSLTSRHQATLDSLQQTTGTQFDQSYVSAQVEAHKESVELFKNYSRNGDNPALKSLAQSTLPKLEEHLKHINGLQAKMMKRG